MTERVRRERLAVIVSRQRITGSTNGSSAYLLAVARTLRGTGFRITLLQPTPALAGRTPVMRLARDLQLFDRHLIRGGLRLGRIVVFWRPQIWLAAAIGVFRSAARRVGLNQRWTIDRPAPYAVGGEWRQPDHDFLDRLMPRDAALVLADYAFCAPCFERAPAGARTAILMHDLFHARESGGCDSVTALSRDKEIELLGTADAVLAIQEQETQFVRDHVPHARAILTPMPAEAAKAAQAGEDDAVLFVGSMTAPNVMGLRWFLAEVWPRACASNPRLKLRVAGTVGRAFEQHRQDVEFLGLVADLDGEYRRAGIVISPLTFGSGLKIKLIEALARGKAMVVTRVTLQGVEGLCERAVIRADHSAQFAEAIVRLAGDPAGRRRLGEAALAKARENFAPGAAHRELREWLLAD